MKLKMKRMAKTTIVMYVLSVLLLFYATYELFNSITYILEYMDAGTITLSDNFGDIVSVIVQACLVYYVYAVLFYVIAKAYQILHDLKINKETIEESTKKETEAIEA